MLSFLHFTSYGFGETMMPRTWAFAQQRKMLRLLETSQRRRRTASLLGMILLLILIVWLGLSGKAHSWLFHCVSAMSWMLTQPLPEVLVVVGIFVILALWLLPKWQVSDSRGLTDQNRFDRENEARKTLAQIIGGVLVLAGLYSSLQTFSLQQQTFSLQQHTFDLQREGQITDRFTKAIDQLGAVETGADGKPKINLEARLGGIYALERIAHDSPKDYRTIVTEIFPTYVRENSPSKYYAGNTASGLSAPGPTTLPPEAKDQPIRADLQAILMVIGMRDRTDDLVSRRIDLSHADLSGADLSGLHLETVEFVGSTLKANFMDAYLDDAHLSEADLRGANLSGVHLVYTLLVGTHLEGAGISGDLKGAFFDNAHLEKASIGGQLPEASFKNADLRGAYVSGNLRSANLSMAHLEGANLGEADLAGADLSGTYLDGADLSRARDVNQSQLNKARGDPNTKLPEGLTRPASWH
jgi:uncharacterized protein YjbI with pentapeptide repeats